MKKTKNYILKSFNLPTHYSLTEVNLLNNRGLMIFEKKNKNLKKN